MRLILPSALFTFLLGVLACRPAQKPVAPGPAIAADPPAEVGTMIAECDAMVAALETFRACPNLDEDDQRDIDACVERAQKDFTAGRKVELEAPAQAAIARSCRRATNSVAAATERCRAGKKPRVD